MVHDRRLPDVRVLRVRASRLRPGRPDWCDDRFLYAVSLVWRLVRHFASAVPDSVRVDRAAARGMMREFWEQSAWDEYRRLRDGDRIG